MTDDILHAGLYAAGNFSPRGKNLGITAVTALLKHLFNAVAQFLDGNPLAPCNLLERFSDDQIVRRIHGAPFSFSLHL